MRQVSVLYGTTYSWWAKNGVLYFHSILTSLLQVHFLHTKRHCIEKVRKACSEIPSRCLPWQRKQLQCLLLAVISLNLRLSHCSAPLIFQSSNSQTIWAIVKSVLLLDYYILQMVWSFHCFLWLFYCLGLAKTNGIGYQFLLYDFLLAL